MWETCPKVKAGQQISARRNNFSLWNLGNVSRDLKQGNMITGASVKKKEKASNAIPMCRPLLHSKPEWKSHASEGNSMLLEKN